MNLAGIRPKVRQRRLFKSCLILRIKSLDSVKAEMRHWVKGYGVFGQSSKLHDLSRVRFAHQSGLFSDQSVDSAAATPFLL